MATLSPKTSSFVGIEEVSPGIEPKSPVAETPRVTFDDGHRRSISERQTWRYAERRFDSTAYLTGGTVQFHRVRHLSLEVLVDLICLLVYLAAFYAYTIAGGAVLVALDRDTIDDMVESMAMDLAQQGFNASQMDFLAQYNIPPAFPDYTVFDGQLYATQLITGIGYGTMSSHSTGARWFAVFYTMFGFLIALKLALLIGSCVFRMFTSCSLLFLMVLPGVSLTRGTGEVWAKKAAVHIELCGPSDESQGLCLWEVRDIITNVCHHTPDWETVCTLVLRAGQTHSGLIQKEELNELMNCYAEQFVEKQQDERKSALAVKAFLLLAWILGGAAYYITGCQCMTEDYGTAMYFEVITLTTVGSGDYYPCSIPCISFWVIYTATGLGMMANIIKIIGQKLDARLPEKETKRMAFTAEYGVRCRWAIFTNFVERFPVLVKFCRSLAIILIYCMIGGAIFFAYEYNPESTVVSFPPDFAEQGFNETQWDYLNSTYLPHPRVWTFSNGMRYSLESLATIGYGLFAPVTSGGRTFAVIYIILGMGLMGLQLDKFAEATRSMLYICTDVIGKHTRWKAVRMKLDDETIIGLNILLEQLSRATRTELALQLEDVKNNFELTYTVSHVKTAVFHAVFGAANIEDCLPVVDRAAASVALACLYHRAIMRRALREIVVSTAIMIIFVVISLPIFMTAEGWCMGDAAWFEFITALSIGLGDLYPWSTLAICWWYVFVFFTAGQLTVLLPALCKLLNGLRVSWASRHTAKHKPIGLLSPSLSLSSPEGQDTRDMFNLLSGNVQPSECLCPVNSDMLSVKSDQRGTPTTSPCILRSNTHAFGDSVPSTPMLQPKASVTFAPILHTIDDTNHLS